MLSPFTEQVRYEGKWFPAKLVKLDYGLQKPFGMLYQKLPGPDGWGRNVQVRGWFFFSLAFPFPCSTSPDIPCKLTHCGYIVCCTCAVSHPRRFAAEPAVTSGLGSAIINAFTMIVKRLALAELPRAQRCGLATNETM